MKPKTIIPKTICHPMFTAELFRIAKMWKQPKRPSVDDGLCDIYTMEYYSAMKVKKILPFATVWMDLENIALTAIGQRGKMPYDFTHICNPMKKVN